MSVVLLVVSWDFVDWIGDSEVQFHQSQANLMWTRIAAISGALSIVFGAFGTHGLAGRDPKLIENWKIASQYHLVHSVALFAAANVPRTYKTAACSLFLGGMLVFSGSLYTLVLTENRKLGMITPFGGLMFIAGWIALAL